MKRLEGCIGVVTIAVIWLLVGGVSATQIAEAHGKHRPRATRADQVRRHGDAKMAKRVARHTVNEAVIRYKLDEIGVPEAEIERAKDEMYVFLKWKLGGPAAIAGQYISAGYDHFEKGYTDEAAAIALGIVGFASKEPELVMP